MNIDLDKKTVLRINAMHYYTRSFIQLRYDLKFFGMDRGKWGKAYLHEVNTNSLTYDH